MKSYKSYFQEESEPLFEMANLSPSRTGIDSGFIYISTKQGKHGCRIKYFSNLKRQEKVFIVSIPDLKIVKDTSLASTLIKKQVLRFAKINTSKLIDFWENGNLWTDDQVRDFQDNLKLTDAQIAEA